MPEVKRALKKGLLIKAVILAVLALVAGVLALQGFDLRALFHRGMDTIQSAGPAMYFTAMALLPVVGVPLLAFALTAGPAFSEQLGMGVVIGLSLAAVAISILLAYTLARWALRPLLARFVDWLGYRMPQVVAADATDLILILRLTPGVPFFVQNCLLGLARVTLGKYLLLSCAIVWSFISTVILFGDALLHGRGKVALCSLSALLALMAAAHFVRRHYARRGPQSLP